LKFSVIIPTNEEESYIEKTLSQFISVRNQFDIEIIVSDAGSTDNTVIISRKYADRVIVNKKNTSQNIAIGRNKGAVISTGDILVGSSG
jgi:glycosyltransferase involved in cell wall biosynthesis